MSVWRRGKGYVFQWTDESGIRRTGSAPTKEDAVAARAARVRGACRARHGVIDASEAKIAAAAARPLVEHLAEWKAALLAKGDTALHASRVHRVVLEVLVDGCGVSRVGGIAVVAADKYVGDQHGTRWKTRTCNHAVKALRAFGAWLEAQERVRRNPLASVHLRRGEDEEQIGAFTLEEALKIIQAADVGPSRYKMSGRERGMFYRLALHTGIRAGGLRGLTPDLFYLDASPAFMVLPHHASKPGNRERKYLAPELVVQLRPWLAEKKRGQLLFKLPAKCDIVRVLRKDMRAAKVPEVNEAGESLKFHSWRHTCISLVTQSGGLVVGKKIAGHASATTTERYAHADKADLLAAAAAIPVIPEGSSAANALHSAGKSGPIVSIPVPTAADVAGDKKGANKGKSAGVGGNSEMGRAGIEPATHGFSVRALHMPKRVVFVGVLPHFLHSVACPDVPKKSLKIAKIKIGARALALTSLRRLKPLHPCQSQISFLVRNTYGLTTGDVDKLAVLLAVHPARFDLRDDALAVVGGPGANQEDRAPINRRSREHLMYMPAKIDAAIFLAPAVERCTGPGRAVAVFCDRAELPVLLQSLPQLVDPLGLGEKTATRFLDDARDDHMLDVRDF